MTLATDFKSDSGGTYLMLPTIILLYLVSPIQKAFAALKRSGTWTVIFSLALSFTCKHHRLQDVVWLTDYRLGFQVLFQPENSAFPTNSRLFEPAEGSERIVAYCIDQDPAGSKFARHAVCPFGVRRAYVGDKPEFRVIGYFNRFGFRLVLQYRQDRSEDFFLGDTHVGSDIGKHGGLHEIPALQSLGMTFSADNELRTFLDT